MGPIGTAPHPRQHSIDRTRIEQQRHRADKQQPGKGEGYSSSRYRQQRGVPTCVKYRVHANHCKQNYPNDKQNIPRKTQPIRNSRKQLSHVHFYRRFRLDRRRHTPLAGSGNRLFMRHHTSLNTFAAYINAHIIGSPQAIASDDCCTAAIDESNARANALTDWKRSAWSNETACRTTSRSTEGTLCVAST